jgi:hypothetical protein
VTPSQLIRIVEAVLVASLLAACAQTKVGKDEVPSERADDGHRTCGYEGDHGIYHRLKCLRVSLEEMMPPNSRLVSDASATARRASYSAPQSER